MNKNKWLIELSESPNARFFRLEFKDLTPEEQVFLSVWQLESEINNGGFHQYFLNSSGDVAWFAPEALERIGASKMAAIVRRANAVFSGGSPPTEPVQRQQALESAGRSALQILDEIDQDFYQYPDDLTSLLFDFVIAHRATIPGVQLPEGFNPNGH
jgi:hypothetical protein